MDVLIQPFYLLYNIVASAPKLSTSAAPAQKEESYHTGLKHNLTEMTKKKPEGSYNVIAVRHQFKKFVLKN